MFFALKISQQIFNAENAKDDAEIAEVMRPRNGIVRNPKMPLLRAGFCNGRPQCYASQRNKVEKAKSENVKMLLGLAVLKLFHFCTFSLFHIFPESRGRGLMVTWFHREFECWVMSPYLRAGY